MILLAILTQLLGFYAIYNTSERAVLLKDSFSIYLQRYIKASKTIGLSLILSSLILLIGTNGFGAGILTGLVVLMTISCLVIILSPINIKKN